MKVSSKFFTTGLDLGAIFIIHKILFIFEAQNSRCLSFHRYKFTLVCLQSKVAPTNCSIHLESNFREAKNSVKCTEFVSWFEIYIHLTGYYFSLDLYNLTGTDLF